MGNIVVARISLVDQEDESEAIVRMRRFCLERLPRYKIPVRFEIVPPEAQHSARFKKVRHVGEISEV